VPSQASSPEYAAARSLLRVPEVASRLSLTERTVWRLLASGDLPSVRIGRSVRISPRDLEQFLHMHRDGIGIPELLERLESALSAEEPDG
jgi:excisionase family DNA binding protein